ncbi:MAG TPA: hypothetical protein VGE66_00475 [Chitinophagaceae bacterium]
MQTREKITLMDKVLRELDDVINSQTSVLKKITQIEADNINLGDDSLADSLPDIHEHVAAALSSSTELQAKFKDIRDDFVSKNPVQEETT